MESGIHVFKPTYNAFQEFTTFLNWVEMIAGREVGVVKVVVPDEALNCFDLCQQGSDVALLRSQKVQVSRSRAILHDVPLYEVAMKEIGGAPVDPEAFKSMEIVSWTHV